MALVCSCLNQYRVSLALLSRSPCVLLPSQCFQQGGSPRREQAGKSGAKLCHLGIAQLHIGGVDQASVHALSPTLTPLPLPFFAACELGFYKSAPGDQLCAKCPLHSHSESRGAQVCRCDSSYYRAAQDPPSAACTREYPPPSRALARCPPAPQHEGARAWIKMCPGDSTGVGVQERAAPCNKRLCMHWCPGGNALKTAGTDS